MKKVVFMLLAVSLLPMMSFAKGLNADLEQVQKKMDKALQTQVAKQNAKALAEKETQEANKALEQLIQNSDRCGSLVNNLYWSHRDLVKVAEQDSLPETTMQNVLFHMEYMYDEFLNLQACDAKAAADARNILNHSYWMSYPGEAVSLARAQALIFRHFGHTSLNMRGDVWFEGMTHKI